MAVPGKWRGWRVRRYLPGRVDASGGSAVHTVGGCAPAGGSIGVLVAAKASLARCCARVAVPCGNFGRQARQRAGTMLPHRQHVIRLADSEHGPCHRYALSNSDVGAGGESHPVAISFMYSTFIDPSTASGSSFHYCHRESGADTRKGGGGTAPRIARLQRSPPDPAAANMHSLFSATTERPSLVRQREWKRPAAQVTYSGRSTRPPRPPSCPQQPPWNSAPKPKHP